MLQELDSKLKPLEPILWDQHTNWFKFVIDGVESDRFYLRKYDSSDSFLLPCINKPCKVSADSGQKTYYFVVIQNILFSYRVVVHYFKAEIAPDMVALKKKPIVRVVGQMAVLSNFSFKCTDVVPLLEDNTINGVALMVGGHLLRVRNPAFH